MFHRQPLSSKQTLSNDLTRSVLEQEAEEAFINDESDDWQTFDLNELGTAGTVLDTMDTVPATTHLSMTDMKAQISDLEEDDDEMCYLMESDPVKSIKVREPVQKGDNVYYICETTDHVMNEPDVVSSSPDNCMEPAAEMLLLEIENSAGVSMTDEIVRTCDVREQYEELPLPSSDNSLTILGTPSSE